MVVQEITKQARDYELVVIISPNVADDAVDGVVARYTKYITDNGGELVSNDKWGKKKLAYPIKHCNEGTYVLTKFKMQPKFTKQLEANLKISEEVLRHLLTNIDS